VYDATGLADTVTVFVGPNSFNIPLFVSNATVPAKPINIFPNPASSVLNIQWTDLQPGNSDVVITDVASRVFYKTSVPNNPGKGSMQLDISALPAGVYFVKIDGTETKKFVKE